jgi:hypothetical protein
LYSSSVPKYVPVSESAVSSAIKEKKKIGTRDDHAELKQNDFCGEFAVKSGVRNNGLPSGESRGHVGEFPESASL